MTYKSFSQLDVNGKNFKAVNFDSIGSKYALDRLPFCIKILLENLINRHNLTPVMPVFDLARGLYALWSGLALQGSIKEALPRDQVFLSFLRNMIVTPST